MTVSEFEKDLRRAAKDLGEKALYYGAKTAADTFFWIARRLRR